MSGNGGVPARSQNKRLHVGCSPAATREKWSRFQSLLGINCKMWKGIIPREAWTSEAYHYFDFYAGPGLYTKEESLELAGEVGSPIRAIETIRAEFPGPCRVFFFDEHPETAKRLAENLQRRFGATIEVPCMSCEEATEAMILAEDLRKPCGLAFFDPNGIPDWRSVCRFGQATKFKRIDILLNINSTAMKRVYSSPNHLNPDYKIRPSEHLHRLGKKRVLLWEPHPGDIHQFALAYCTNGPGPEWEESRFSSIGTPQGQRIARRIDLSYSERMALGGTTGYLFDPKGGAS